MSCSDEEHNMDYIDEMPSDSHSHDCKEKFSFQGRHLTTMSQDSPFKLTKNQLQTWSMHTDSRSFIFLQLQTLSGREDISTLLLVVCPTGKAVRHRIHIFCTGSQNHLGSAQVTPEEVDLLERHHRPDNYSLVYCSLSITLQDMVGNGVIKREIFDVVRNQSQVSWHSEYQGKPLCISYKSSTSDVQLPIRNTLPEGIGDVQEQSNEEQKVSKVDPSSTQTFAQKWLFLESQKKAEIQSKRMLMEGNKSASEVTRLSEGSKSHQPNLPAIAGTEDAQSALKAETEKNLKEVEDRQASSLTQLKTTESQKSTAEDSSLKQKRRHHSVPASNQVATRLPHIRKFALRQSKSEELRQKREEERKADEAQRNPNAKSKSSKEEQEEQKRKQQKLNQPSLHFSQTRSFLLRRQVTEAAIKRRDEALRKEQKRILPSLLESQRRLPSIRYSALRPSKTELKKKRREDRRKQQQSLQRQRRAAEARWICEEEERARREQEERKGEQHKPLKQVLHFSPTRSFLLRRQVAEEAAQKQGDVDGGAKEESKHKSLPASPRRLSSVRNGALRQSKSPDNANIEIKTEEDKRKQAAEARWNRDEHKLIQRALDCSPTRSSSLRKQTAVEAAPQQKDEDWHTEQERLEQTLHELPNPQEDQLPETSRSAQKRHVRFSFNQVDEDALKDCPSQMSGTFVLPPSVMKYNTPQRGAEGKRRERELREESAQRKKILQRSILRDVPQQTREQLSNTPNGQPTHVEPKARESAPAETDGNGLRTLLPPVKLKESAGHVALLSMIPGIESKVSIIQASSETFCRFAKPVKIPAEFSRKACLYLRGKLQNLSARRAFTKFGNLVSAINNNPTPRTEHLVAFFQFAEIIEFQMYARKERRFSQSSYAREAEPIRHRVDCYVFKDRCDYIASISLYSVLLLQIRKLFPTVARNLHFIDDVYELAHVPRHVANCLKVGLKSLNAPSTIYPVLGEILYSMRQPKASLIELNSDMLEN